MIKFIKNLTIGSSSWVKKPFQFGLEQIESKPIEEYTHRYLFCNYTHNELSALTQGELSSKGENENG